METMVLPYLKSMCVDPDQYITLTYTFNTIEIKLSKQFVEEVLGIDDVIMRRAEDGSTTSIRYWNWKNHDNWKPHVHCTYYRRESIMIIKLFGYLNKNKFVSSKDNTNNSNSNSNNSNNS
eukprot:217541_1